MNSHEQLASLNSAFCVNLDYDWVRRLCASFLIHICVYVARYGYVLVDFK